MQSTIKSNFWKKSLLAGASFLALAFAPVHANQVEQWIYDSIVQKVSQAEKKFSFNGKFDSSKYSERSTCFSSNPEVAKKNVEQKVNESGPATLKLIALDSVPNYRLEVHEKGSSKISEYIVLNSNSNLHGKYFYAPVFVFDRVKGLQSLTNKFRLPCSSCSGSYTAQGSVRYNDSSFVIRASSVFEQTRCGIKEINKEESALTIF